MLEDRPVAYILDDDASVRRALSRLLDRNGMSSIEFASAQEFLHEELPHRPACIILDVWMPGLNGLELQAELTAKNIQLPIIFITGRGDIPMTIEAMRAGAIDFLPKPLDDEAILGAVARGIKRDRACACGETGKK